MCRGHGGCCRPPGGTTSASEAVLCAHGVPPASARAPLAGSLRRRAGAPCESAWGARATCCRWGDGRAWRGAKATEGGQYGRGHQNLDPRFSAPRPPRPPLCTFRALKPPVADPQHPAKMQSTLMRKSGSARPTLSRAAPRRAVVAPKAALDTALVVSASTATFLSLGRFVFLG